MVRVRLTPSGRTAVDGAMGNLLERERALLGRLTATEQAQLAALLRTLLEGFDERYDPAESVRTRL